MKVTLYDNQEDLECSKDTIKNIVIAALQFKKIDTDEVIVHLVDTTTISTLHEEYFNDTNTTDCITFPIDPPEKKDSSYHLLGEMFICPKTAIEYAENNNPFDEVTLYIIHCILHMCGFKDDKEQEKKIMRLEEAQLLKHLSSKNLFPHK